MKSIVRASVMVLMPALAATALRAEECRIGPAAFEAPACTIGQDRHFEGPAQYVRWEEGGTFYTVFVIAPDRRRDFRGYLNRWRHSHKCTAEEISFGEPVRLAAPDGSTPPQKTWTGNCAAPVTYMVRAIRLKRVVVELHVDRTRSNRPALEPAFASLLGRVRLQAE